jgi:D-threo-aldose 1-dehydrogenase
LYKSTFDQKAAQRSLDDSLRELGTQYIDLLLLHDPVPSQFNALEMYELLERARASGKIRSWGVAGEVQPTSAAIKQLPGPTPVIQIRDDIFRRDECVALASQCEYLITFGILGDVLPKILAHVTSNKELTQQWNDAVGADCTDPHTVVGFLLRDAVRANGRGTVLYSTTRAERIRSAAALFSRVTASPDAALDAFRQLVATQLGQSDATPKEDQ